MIDALLAQDYISGLFVDSDIGTFAGTLPLSAINMQGKARTPRPAIVVNFRSYATDCGQPVMCAVSVADTTLQQGQGMHGSFSRADTLNFMAAIGPSFKTGFVDQAPVSNADVGKTIAHALGLNIPFKGALQGRVVEEALPGGLTPTAESWVERGKASEKGLATILVGPEHRQDALFRRRRFPGPVLLDWMSVKPQAADVASPADGKSLPPGALPPCFPSPKPAFDGATVLLAGVSVPLRRWPLY